MGIFQARITMTIDVEKSAKLINENEDVDPEDLAKAIVLQNARCASPEWKDDILEALYDLDGDEGLVWEVEIVEVVFCPECNGVLGDQDDYRHHPNYKWCDSCERIVYRDHWEHQDIPEISE